MAHIWMKNNGKRWIPLIKNGVMQKDIANMNRFIFCHGNPTTTTVTYPYGNNYITQQEGFVELNAISDGYIQSGGSGITFFTSEKYIYKITGRVLAYYYRQYVTSSSPTTATYNAFGRSVTIYNYDKYQLMYGIDVGGTKPSGYQARDIDYESNKEQRNFVQAYERRNAGSGVTGASQMQVIVRIYGDLYIKRI